MHFGRTRRRLVYLIYNNDGFESKLERLLQHETCLWHRAFLRVDNEEYCVDRAEHALYFGTEVAVAWCVHDVDLALARRSSSGGGWCVKEGSVFSVNSDATLLLKGIGVHRHTFGDHAVLA